MEKIKTEQRFTMKFLLKLKKSMMETFQLLTETYNDAFLSPAAFFNDTDDF